MRSGGWSDIEAGERADDAGLLAGCAVVMGAAVCRQEQQMILAGSVPWLGWDGSLVYSLPREQFSRFFPFFVDFLFICSDRGCGDLEWSLPLGSREMQDSGSERG